MSQRYTSLVKVYLTAFSFCAIGFVHGDNSDLLKAAESNDTNTVNAMLLDGADVSVTQTDGATALHWAAHNGHRGVVKVLLDRGVHPDTPGSNWCAPLHWAASRGHRDVVKLLLDFGADPNWADLNEWTPLHSAANVGHRGVVLILLDKDNASVSLANNEARGKWRRDEESFLPLLLVPVVSFCLDHNA